MPSASFTINGTAITTGLVQTTGGATVTLALANSSGVQSIEWSCVGTHASTVTPASIVITPAGSPSGATATFTMTAGTYSCLLIKCLIRDVYNVATVAYGLVGVPNSEGFVPFAAGESTERHPTMGWTEALNNAVKGAGTTVSGSLATATSFTYDVPITALKQVRLQIQGMVGNGAGDVLYLKTHVSRWTNPSGTAVLEGEKTGEEYGSGFTLTAAVSTSNCRYTLANTSGSTRSYRLDIETLTTAVP